MGKIGDLIVRLQLKHQDYEKGLKKAEKDTQGFGATLGKIKGVGLAVWAAIGGAVLKVASDIVKSTNQMEDRWAMFTAKAKAGWDTFIKSLANGDFSNFVNRYKQAIIAAEYLQEALDATTEVENSIRLQKAGMAEELAALEVLMRDQTKSYEERAAAAQKYIDKVSPIYDQEIKRLEDLKKAYMVDFGKGIWSAEAMTSPGMMAAVEKFLTEYGKSTTYELLRGKTLAETMSQALVAYDPAPKGKQAVSEQRQRKAAIEQLQWLSESWGWGANTLYYFGKQYETQMNGEGIQALVESIALFYEALGAKKSDLKKVYGILNSATAQIQKSGADSDTPDTPAAREWGAMIEALPSITAPAMSMEVPDILPDDWLTRNREKIDEALAEVARLQGITDEINRSFENAVISSLSGATQALTDCIAGIEGADATQVLSALMQPFANTMIQLGEMLIAEGLAISAFKESLKSLNPYVALAAGAALLAVGAALSSGIKKLGATAGSGATTTSTSASSSASGIQNVQSELTIYVKGSLKGSDIVLSGQRTLNSWAR